MPLPSFYIEQIPIDQSSFTLNEDTSKHVVQVLRMKPGEHVQLTDGKGKIISAEIVSDHKKATQVKVISTSNIVHRSSKITIAISLIKNSSRFEWFLEKAAEIGVTGIIPLICERTEKHNFRYHRMKNILISAMLQSQQAWLPTLQEPVYFKEVIQNSNYQKKYIAYCSGEEKKWLSDQPINQSTDQLILIGPEGDFTMDEIRSAEENNFTPVTLGDTRLRTETAGIVACVLLARRQISF